MGCAEINSRSIYSNYIYGILPIVMNDSALLTASIYAAVEAGVAALEIYDKDFEVEFKADDSPLTLADKQSHRIIAACLADFDIPMLSEEGKSIPFEARGAWPSLLVVDPLDGTKEFIKKNGEFTINIALVCDRRPVMGVIYVPVKKRLYFALKDLGAYRLDIDHPEHIRQISYDQLRSISDQIRAAADPNRPFTIVGSRSHATPELTAYVADKRKSHGNLDFISAGSSLKFCLVAEGRADVYPRLGPTMEWDTAAGHAIAEAAGAAIFCSETRQPLLYNKPNLLNPWFVVSNGRH